MSNDDLTIEPGTNVDDVVSFRLSPQFNGDDELEAVCVTDIQSAENIVFNNGNSDSNSDSSNNDESSNDEDNGTTQGIGQAQSTNQ